ncbi:hypothetical protein Dda_0160 [Drechslerella dactyloides]|uniref:Uncharacterized protein n=1 Tax=Drechslerella dactyloides TaxID=74499 RepID=A0AAD6J4N2_DREDA|nr:hypothetical protein Dda_0160 [Drechslerella dactyloides]
MKFSLLPLLAVATSASPIMNLSPRSASGCFAITSFYNSGSPHSISARVSFNLNDAATGLYASCFASQSIQPSIATTPFPTACNDTSVVFGVEVKTGVPGYWLTIAHLTNGNKTVDTGSFWLGADIQRFDNPSGNPNGDYDYLNVPTSFSVGYNQYTQA